MVYGMAFRVLSLVFRVLSLAFRVLSMAFRVLSLVSRPTDATNPRVGALPHDARVLRGSSSTAAGQHPAGPLSCPAGGSAERGFGPRSRHRVAGSGRGGGFNCAADC